MLVLVLVSALLSFCVAILTRRLAFKIQAVDAVQGGRKIHTQPTPLLGGVGIGATIILATIALTIIHPGADIAKHLRYIIAQKRMDWRIAIGRNRYSTK